MRPTRQTDADEQAERGKIRLLLPASEAQIVFELIGAAVLPKRDRKLALKTYQRLERAGFIHGDFS